MNPGQRSPGAVPLGGAAVVTATTRGYGPAVKPERLHVRPPWRDALPTGALVVLTAPLWAACVVPAGPEKEISGEELFERHCARCHGADGKGDPTMPSARDLTNESYMASKNDEQIQRVIMQGRPPNMPAFGGQFGEPSMKVLVGYVRSLSDPSVAGATRPPEERAQSGQPSDEKSAKRQPDEG